MMEAVFKIELRDQWKVEMLQIARIHQIRALGSEALSCLINTLLRSNRGSNVLISQNRMFSS